MGQAGAPRQAGGRQYIAVHCKKRPDREREREREKEREKEREIERERERERD
jgi:hypothetical protein